MKSYYLLLIVFCINTIYAQVASPTNTTFLWADFEDTTFLAPGWTVDIDTATGISYWSRAVGVSGYGVGSGSAKFSFYNAPSGTQQNLKTKVFPVSSTGDSLYFDYAYAPYVLTRNDQIELTYSTDAGITYHSLAVYNAVNDLATASAVSIPFVPTSTQWSTKRIALPIGTNKLCFKTTSAYGNNLYLDNIRVGQRLAIDVGILSINLPSRIIQQNTTVKVSVQNFGTQSLSSITIKVNIQPGGTNLSRTISSLAPGAINNAVIGGWNPAVSGIYTLKASVSFTGDTNTFNDTASMKITVVNSGWASGASMPHPSYMGAGCTAVINDTPYVFALGGGNYPSTSAYRYNCLSNTWDTILSMPDKRLIMSAAYASGSIYVFGGSDSLQFTSTIMQYDMSAKTWNYVGNLPFSIGYTKAYPYQDSLIYIIGGLDNEFQHFDVLLFNAKENSLRRATSLPDEAGTYGGAMAISGNKIVYVGGFVYNIGLVPTNYVGTIDNNDHTQITWTTGSPYPAGRRYKFDASAWKDGVIMAGGAPNEYGGDWLGQQDCYSYNVSTDTWQQQPIKPTQILGAYVGSYKNASGGWRYVVAGGVVNSNFTGVNEIFYEEPLTGVKNEKNIIPTEFSLNQNYPNPFNPSTKISYSLPKNALVKLIVYNILGQKITELVNQEQGAGIHEVMFNASGLASGVYLYSLNVNNSVYTKKMILLK